MSKTALKHRTYEDYEQLGGLLYLAREALHAALIGSNGKLYAAQQDRINRTADKVDELRSLLEDQFCRDGLDRSAHTGTPLSPIYLGNFPKQYEEAIEAAIEEVRSRIHEDARR